MIHRRSFITGLVSLVAAPAIVRAGSLMPVRTMIVPYGIGPMMDLIPESIERERQFIDDYFFRGLFKLLNEQPNMTMTQLLETVVER